MAVLCAVSGRGWMCDKAREEGGVSVEVVTTDLIARARAGDGEAFRELTEPYRRELLVHCYRMLGSFQDAEDVVQDTLLAAWQGFGGCEGRACCAPGATGSPPTGASTRVVRRADDPPRSGTCPRLSRPSRPGSERSYGSSHFPTPSSTRGRSACRSARRPATSKTESISLAFVTALQALPPRQLAVLVLRDVLGFHANEVANMLDSTMESVNSALKRARQPAERPVAADRRARTGSRPRLTLRAGARGKFVRAYESGIWAGWSPCSPTISSSRCRRFPSNTKVATSWPASSRASSAQAGGSASSRPEPTVSRRSGPTCAPPQASATDPACRPHPHRRPHLRLHPIRKQRAPIVRATAIAPEPITSFRAVEVRRRIPLRRACDLAILSRDSTENGFVTSFKIGRYVPWSAS
jgi:DNA-directed RNA polymerase specialized sigma24 family protein